MSMMDPVMLNPMFLMKKCKGKKAAMVKVFCQVLKVPATTKVWTLNKHDLAMSFVHEYQRLQIVGLAGPGTRPVKAGIF